jgi:ABC-2 type transport system permease protein
VAALIPTLKGRAARTALRVATAAACGTSIQFWFRAQARRSQFRRRQTSSRIATFAEALSSCSWAGAGGLAAASTWLAAIPGLISLAVLTGAWIISPAKNIPRSTPRSFDGR